MPVSDRAKRLRALAKELNRQFELPADTVHAVLDDYSRSIKWYLRWTDGPSLAQLTKAAEGIDAEVLAEATLYRTYSPFVWALVTIRLTMSTEALPPREGYYPNTWHIREWLTPRKAPRSRSKREQVLAARLAARYPEGEHATETPESLICDDVARNGVGPLLFADGPGQAPLTPVEVLTARYASGEDRAAWNRHLTPMDALAAFQAAAADEAPEPAVTAAVLELLPDLHRRIDAAAAALQARTPAEP
ncbi:MULTISPECIES: hypothetical protein [unclassified Streptomyces]|uniref:hypothetical protein n=1 Tax=unclassified Streptomyces TaxID=2593676 RepID=UPI00332DB4DE